MTDRCGQRRGKRKTAIKLTLTLLLAVIINGTLIAITQMTPGSPHDDSSSPHVMRVGSRVRTDYWAKTYGGSGNDSASSVQETSDGGYIVAGETQSFGAGNYDFWVLKLSPTGSVTWQKTFGGGGRDQAYCIQQASDGGYIVVGETDSFGAGHLDVWVLKLADDGSVEWQNTYGGIKDDHARSVEETSDGGFILGGDTYSFGAGDIDCWVLKLRENGSVEWQKTYGGSDYDWANAVKQTSDGGYIVAGDTLSFDEGGVHFWVSKLSSDGSVVWEKSYENSDKDYAYSVQQTSDGGYIVAGETNASISAQWGDGSDFWVLKLDSSGSIEWQRIVGTNNEDWAYCVQQTSDGGYIVAGYSVLPLTVYGRRFAPQSSTGCTVTRNPNPRIVGWGHFILVKLGSTGDLLWAKYYQGATDSRAVSVWQSSDQGYIVAGETLSVGDSFGAGAYDAWVVKSRAGGEVTFGGSYSWGNDISASTMVSSAVTFVTSAEVTNSSGVVQASQIAPQNTFAIVQIQTIGRFETIQWVISFALVLVSVAIVITGGLRKGNRRCYDPIPRSLLR